MPKKMKTEFSKIIYWFIWACISIFGIHLSADNTDASDTAPWDEEVYHSPISVLVSAKRAELYVINQTANSLSIIDQESYVVKKEVSLGQFPTDATLSNCQNYLFVTCLYDYSIQMVDLDNHKVTKEISVGFEPYGLVLSKDGKHLYVANSISNSVSAISTDSMTVTYETSVGRNPRYLVELSEKNLLIVTNGLSRSVSFLDTRTGKVTETRNIDRSSVLRGITTTHSGDYALAVGMIAHDEMITMQIERGWINSNGVYVMKVDELGHFVTVPLDSLLNGAANPWGILISPDDQRLYIALSGVHEIAYVNLPKLLKLVEETDRIEVPRLSQNVEIFDKLALGKRFKTDGNGPRGIALDENRMELYAANYFTNNISVMDALTGVVKAMIPLGDPKELTLWRKGEMLFSDARLCQQNYYSCASCHQEDATMDGLNWDLINDGRGNPKNAKSLHDAMDTPPVMWSGVRADMFAGVAAGQRFLGFIPNEDNHKALTEFIGNPRRAPNPYRNANPESLARGEELFYRARCHICHIPPTYSDVTKYDLGLRASFELRSRFFTPSLKEAYRTAPYLHNGFAETLEELFTVYNPDNKHGLTNGLSKAELADLVTYLKSL